MVTLEELRRKHQELINNESKKTDKLTSDFISFKPDTKNLVRILPGAEDPSDDNYFKFYTETNMHKIQLSPTEYKNYQCRKSFNEACPVCDLMFQLWDRHRALKLPKGEKSKYGDMATKIKPRPRYYMKVVVRSLIDAKDENGNMENPVKFLAMSKELFDRILSAVTDSDLQEEDDPDNTTILSLEKGNDFEIVVTKKGEYNSFTESKAKVKKSRAGTPKQIAEWMESPLKLDSLSKLEEYEEGKKLSQTLLAKLEGTSTASESDEKPPFDTDEDDDSRFNKEMRT